MERPVRLEGWRVLAPPARAGSRDVLRTLLERAGADVVSFPRLAAQPPPGEELARVVDALEGAAWLVLAGADSVENLFGHPGATVRVSGSRVRIAAIGGGTAAALRRRGLAPDLVPDAHTADVIAAALGASPSDRVVLVRESRASAELPEELRRRGAEVVEGNGYVTRLVDRPEDARIAFARPPDVLALANPSAARSLTRAARELGLELGRCLAGVVVAAAGPATARAAARHGFAADLVAGGRLASMVRGIERLGVTRR